MTSNVPLSAPRRSDDTTSTSPEASVTDSIPSPGHPGLNGLTAVVTIRPGPAQSKSTGIIVTFRPTGPAGRATGDRFMGPGPGQDIITPINVTFLQTGQAGHATGDRVIGPG